MMRNRDGRPSLSARRAGAAPPDVTLERAALRVDLLRADLYRMLDEMARAGAGRRRAVVREFERAWESYKKATAGPS